MTEAQSIKGMAPMSRTARTSEGPVLTPSP